MKIYLLTFSTFENPPNFPLTDVINSLGFGGAFAAGGGGRLFCFVLFCHLKIK